MKPESPIKTTVPKPKKKREKTVSQAMTVSAMDRCRAVLSIWTEKRKPAEVCREYKVQWMVLKHWQNRALEGMLQALEPRVKLAQGPMLNPKLQTLLERYRKQHENSQVKTLKLENRLSKIQEKTETAA